MARFISSVCMLAFVLVVPACGNGQNGQDAQDAQEDWRLYQFQAGEYFRYEFTQIDGGETNRGSYSLAIEPAGQGRLKMSVEGKMGEAECSASATTESAQAFPPQLMMGCATIGPVMMAFALPAWGWFMGRTWQMGDEWSMSQGGESFSFRIERECSYAGQKGTLAVVRTNGEVHLQSCVSRRMALPLMVMLREDDGESIELKLVEYRR